MIVTVLGAINDTATVTTVLPVLGAGMVAAGLAVVLMSADLVRSQTSIVGGTLIAAGTIATVIGGASSEPTVQAALTPLSGAIFIAGLITTVLGLNDTQTSNQPQSSRT